MDDQIESSSMGNYLKYVKVFLWLGIIIYGTFYFLSYFDFSFIKGEIVEYGIQCDSKPVNNYCPKALFSLRAQHYKPNKDRQEVISWTTGFPPERLTNCAIIDRKNWQCEFDDKSATFGFQDGVYFNYPAVEHDYNKEYYVSRQTWLSQDCGDSIYSKWLCIPFHQFFRGN